MRDIKNLKVKFNEIPHGGLDLHSSQSHELDAPLFDLLGEAPKYEVIAKLSQLETMTQLKGNISAQLSHACSRCAETFESPLKKKFTTLYYKSEEGIKTISNEGLDDFEGSFDLEFISGNELDLGEVIHEQIAIEIPFQPLCAEDCKGLCTQCGANLNTDKNHVHNNSENMTDSPFAKLKALRGD